MTSEELKTFFENIIDDTWDTDATYLLMQSEQEKLENERDWMVLRNLDTSITVTASDDWTTAKTLPTNFVSARKVYVGSEQNDPYIQISMDQALQYKNQTGYYYIDYAQMKIHFTGVHSQTYTVYLYYKKSMGNITAGTETFPWPGNRATVIGFRMAQHHKGGIDGDEVNFQMTPEQARQYKETHNALIQWDTNLQLKALGN